MKIQTTVGKGLTLQIHEDGTATLNDWVIPEGVDPFEFAAAVGQVWDSMPKDGNYHLERVIIATCEVANVCPGDLSPKLIADMQNDVAQNDPSCGPVCRGFQAMLAAMGGAMIGAEGPGMPAGGIGGDLSREFGGAERRLGSGACRNSFAGDTQILMADGTTKPISQVHAGDHVKATDPAIAHTADEAVAAQILTTDTELTDIAVGDVYGNVSIIHTTPTHPFWDRSIGLWVDADALDPYHQLSTADGTAVTVLAIQSFAGRQLMYNLTVDTIHTYYVIVGTTSVLVHNTGPDCGTLINEGPSPQNAYDVLARVDDKKAPFPGYKGGRPFANDGRQGTTILPRGNGETYQEWDVHPNIKGVDRGGERLVTGSDGSAWYTNDHYESFFRIR